MTKKLLSDYIKVFDNTIFPEECEAIIARFEAASAEHDVMRVENEYSYVQWRVSKFWPEGRARIGQVLSTHLLQYHQMLGIGEFWPEAPMTEEIRLKRYSPDGRDKFPLHVDVTGQANINRFIAAILYLNKPGGGETVFPDLDVTVEPATGRLVIFPPLWLFPHAGLPPQGSAKYILNSYLWYPPDAKPGAIYP